ncbi:MAG: hypothetical protein ABIS20_07815 [Thermoanaerobaculia bacterium]
MICPKCGFEQPDGAECARCGVILSRYKGLGAPPPPPPPLAGPVFESPALAGAGTVYDGPASIGGGTVYQGPPPGSPVPAPGTFRRTFGVGEVLGETFSIYFANLLPFTLLTALALAPAYALIFLVGRAPQASMLVIVSGLLLGLVSILASNIATGAITFGVFQQLRGKDASIGECLSRGLSLLLPVFGLAFVQSLAIGVAMLACLVPGIMLAVRWAVSVPAAVTEGTGVSNSMQRSSFLTDGMRWDVFGVLFVLGVIQIGATLLVNLVVGNPTLVLLLTGVKNLLVVGLSATGSAVMYYRLRSLKESIDVDQIASVFG